MNLIYEKKVFLVVTLGLVFWATGCEQPVRETDKPGAAQYIKSIYSMPSSLDPVRMNDTVSLVVSNLIYDGLLRFNSKLEFEGALAESWSSDRTGRIYTFKLRDGIRFHDGKPITTSDVVGSLSRAVAPGSTVFKYYDCILGAKEYFEGKAKQVTGIRSDSSGNVIIELKFPFPPFLSILAGATAKVLPLGVNKDSRFFDLPVGSGPFRITQIRKESKTPEIQLERFDAYKGDKPRIKDLILRVFSQDEAIRAASLREVHDLANFPLTGTEEVFNKGQHLSSPVAATWIIGFNTRKPPFNNLEVRRAFKASVDSEAFREKFYPDAHSANGYIPIGLPGHISSKANFDNRLLVGPTKRKIEIAFPELLANQKEMRSFLEEMLRKKGWSVSFVPMEWNKLMEGYDKKTYQAFVVSMNMDYPDTEFLIRNFESNNPDNFSGLEDKEVQALLQKARLSQDRFERNKIYESIVQRLEDLAVTVNLFHPRAHYWVHPCVRNFEPNILADYYIDYRNVSLDSACLENLSRRGER